MYTRGGRRIEWSAANVKIRVGAPTGNLEAGPGGGGRRGQEFAGEGGRTLQATYCFACNLLLGLPPSAFLKNNNKV